MARFAPEACAGPLLAAELEALAKALDKPAKPVVAIVGGSKVSTKLDVLNALSKVCDQIIVGGGIANTFLAAAGHKVGNSLCEHDLINTAKVIADNVEIPLPVDVVVAKQFAEDAEASLKNDRRGGGRRHDPRYRPGDRQGVREPPAQRQDHSLEWPGRRIRI